MHKTTRWSAAVGAGLTLALGLVTPASAGAAPGPGSAPATTVGVSAASAAKLPASWQAKRAAAAERFGIEPSPADEVVREIIDPDDYACEPTRFRDYIQTLLAGVSEADLEVLSATGALDFPAYEAFLFGTSSDQAFALDPDHRVRVNKAFRDAQRFWDIESDDIQLMGMDGGIMRDRSRMVRLLTTAFGATPQEAASIADTVAEVVARVPALQKGDNPIFSLNAFALSNEGETDPLLAAVPDKIVMGDGINDAFEYMGIADVGPSAVLSHEFGHHIQFENDLFDSPLEGAEATRRTELMADAYATYHVTHKRGLGLNVKRVVKAQQSFYEVGDCSFDSPGHHGTPNQRRRAAQWGADLAANVDKDQRRVVLPSMTVAQKFDAVLPQLVAPDAP